MIMNDLREPVAWPTWLIGRSESAGFTHGRERQSRCVTTTGPGRRARSAVSHTSSGMVAVRENPAWCGRLRVGVAHWRQGRRKAGTAVYPRRHGTGRSAARPDADLDKSYYGRDFEAALSQAVLHTCCARRARVSPQGPARSSSGRCARPSSQAMTPSKASSTWNATAGTPQPG